MLWALLRQYARPYRWLLAIVALLQLISTLASLYLPTVNAAIIDEGVAKGDLRIIVELGGVMLAVTALQVLCAIGAVYFGSRAGTGFGRDLRSAIFNHVTGFSAEETARFGAASLLTRTTNDVQQIQLLVQLTCTMLITAPIMSIGGIFMAVHQDAGLSWLLLVSVPILAAANYWIVSHLLPIFRRMQRLIDGINRVMREQLAGIRVIRAFTRESFERSRFEQANRGGCGHRGRGGALAGIDAALDDTGHQHLQRRADLVRRPADRRRPDAGRIADRVPLLLHADPDGGAACDVHPGSHSRARRYAPNASQKCWPPNRRSPARRIRSRPAVIEGEIRLDGATFSYPGRRTPCAAGCFVDRAAGDDDRDRRVNRFGQVDVGVADLPAVRRDVGVGAHGRSRRARLRPRTAVGGDRCWCHSVDTCSRAPSPTTCATAKPTRPTTRCGTH